MFQLVPATHEEAIRRAVESVNAYHAHKSGQGHQYEGPTASEVVSEYLEEEGIYTDWRWARLMREVSRRARSG